MSTRAYHLHELEIARSLDDSRRVMPEIRPQHRRVLDLGCGAGQTLIASDLPRETWAAGVDVDFDALLTGPGAGGAAGLRQRCGRGIALR
ncbi:MAG: hypothetical protein KDH89_13210 [Anaerolineae bacterium]|nr:hypothetical protein [Anaerolineae bacterium]